MADAILDIISGGLGAWQTWGIGIAVLVVIMKIWRFFQQKEEQRQIDAMPEEERIQHLNKQDDYEFMGMLIGIPIALIISGYIIYLILTE